MSQYVNLEDYRNNIMLYDESGYVEQLDNITQYVKAQWLSPHMNKLILYMMVDKVISHYFGEIWVDKDYTQFDRFEGEVDRFILAETYETEGISFLFDGETPNDTIKVYDETTNEELQWGDDNSIYVGDRRGHTFRMEYFEDIPYNEGWYYDYL